MTSLQKKLKDDIEKRTKKVTAQQLSEALGLPKLENKKVHPVDEVKFVSPTVLTPHHQVELQPRPVQGLPVQELEEEKENPSISYTQHFDEIH